jgi:3-dehydrotetronate 4-kinase
VHGNVLWKRIKGIVKPYLGCIADDFTGGTDVASMLTRYGMRTLLLIGTPKFPPPSDVDALVIALKSRTIEPQLAITESLEALSYLQTARCHQIYFKYCSTFDSTDRGNIGPVIDALMTALEVPFTIACPAFPENNRTIYKGYLFVGDVLLNESGMRNHPLTPMLDANLVRILQRQTTRKVGLIPLDTLRRGALVVRAEISALRASGVEIAIADAISEDDLESLGAICSDLRLVTAGSGLAQGVAVDLVSRGMLARHPCESAIEVIQGKRAILAGSCSAATQGQVAEAISSGMPSFAIDPLRLATGEPIVQEALHWASTKLEKEAVLIYATTDQMKLQLVQSALGVDQAGRLVEEALATIAMGLVEGGVTQLIVAGGETSGAVVKALKVEALKIGAEIAPGVPWTATIGSTKINLALKSGNFGASDLFLSGWKSLC